MQLWWGEPLLNLILAMAATILFFLFLPIYLEKARLHGNRVIGHFALGLLVGLVLDTTIHGAFGTYDTIWQPGLIPMLLTLALVLGQWLMLAKGTATRNPGATATGGFGVKSLAWLAIGPFLFLQLVVFQNIARLTVPTGWSLPIAFGWTLLAQLLALAAAVWLLSKERRTLWPVALISGIVLLIVSILPNQPEAWLAALTFLLGQLSLGVLLVVVLIGISQRVDNSGFSGITAANGLGMLLLLVFVLGYYVVYQISLPYSNTVLEPIAASVVTVCALVSSVTLRQGIKVNRRAWLVPGLAVLLLVLPLAGSLKWQEPRATADEGFPVRVMTYNLHNGFNTDGYLGMEALARVIENSHPDIVALQEISRGWLVSGRLDMLTWLSQRLEMPYVSGPTAGPFWGNAILSRYPVIEHSSYDLPPRDLPVLRGFTAALIDLGNGNRLQFIVTHFHHVEEDSAIRQLQSQAIVDFWDGASHTVILGDFNGQPNTPEIEMLRQAGLVDAMAAIEPASIYTFHSANLYQRIDYIWVSSDLEVSEAHVPVSNASDHLPVVAVINN
jgi:endonuclease/exonuclease/phosphatase family metal-dependent hydrolase